MANRVSLNVLEFDKGYIRDLMDLPVNNRARLDVVTRALRDAIENELTPRQREVLLMQFFERLSGREIARRLGITPSTVTRTQQRAKERLRKSLRFYMEFLNCSFDEDG